MSFQQPSTSSVVRERLSSLGRSVLLAPKTPPERNIYFLYIEIVFAAALGAAASFNAAYVLRLGGSNTLVGLLSSLPSLVAMFLYLPSARILESKSRYMPWVVGGLFLTRAGYLVIPLLPFFLRAGQPEATVAILVAVTVPSVFFSTGWSPMLSDVLPVRSRASVLAWRSILSSATIAPLIFLAGRWLDKMAFPGNYQALYLFGFAAGSVSTYLVSRIRPQVAPQSAPKDPGRPMAEPISAVLRSLAHENRGFGRIIVNTLLYSLGAWMLGPLYMIFFVRNLGATDGWIGLNGTLAHVGVIAGYWLWRRIIRHTGVARALLIALPLVASYPFMVALVPHLTFILFAAFVINVLAPGVDLSHSVIFLDLLRAGQKHSLTALYSTVMNVGAFVCPLIGVALSGRIGIIPTLLIGGSLRLVGAMLFYLFPVKPLESKASAS